MPAPSTDLPPKVGRATALPPDERRAAITEATVDLLVRGGAVTTRQIAEAAGVAEGTMFRVFPDKEAVVQAAVDHVLDPAPLQEALAAVDRTRAVEDQLADAVRIIGSRIELVWRVLSSAGPSAAGPRRPPAMPGLVALFEPIKASLRVSPAAAARQLRALAVAMAHPDLGDAEPLGPEEVVSLLLDGIRHRGGARR